MVVVEIGSSNVLKQDLTFEYVKTFDRPRVTRGYYNDTPYWALLV